jgi:glycosyltransferase involved in cell wall biosynthesis
VRILKLALNLGPGGIQRGAVNLAVGLSKGGCEVGFLAVREAGPREAALRDSGIPVWTGSEGVGHAAAWQPDILFLHSHGGRQDQLIAAVDAIREQVGRRIPAIENNSFALPHTADKLERIDLSLVLGEWCLFDWAARTAHFETSPPLAILPHLVDVEPFFPASQESVRAFRDEHGIPAAAPIIGRIGQPAAGKWSSAIVDVFADLAPEFSDLHLVLVGAPDEVLNRILKHDADLRSRVVAIPFLHGDEDLRVCYSAMDVFVHAARIGESFGLVLAEAMLCETPVVTLATPHISNVQCEVVGHRRGGWSPTRDLR